ncbi:hypothetical protein GCM10010207_64180 [Streptomyces atratus]|nr:hypothetical protein GCM10010207_64180 [Streptomyces atratus]
MLDVPAGHPVCAVARGRPACGSLHAGGAHLASHSRKTGGVAAVGAGVLRVPVVWRYDADRMCAETAG